MWQNIEGLCFLWYDEKEQLFWLKEQLPFKPKLGMFYSLYQNYHTSTLSEELKGLQVRHAKHSTFSHHVGLIIIQNNIIKYS